MTRRYHLHMPGLIYCGLALLVGLAAVNSQNNLLFWVLGVMVTAILISGLISGAMMTGLRARRLDPRHGAVGEPLVVRYELTNRRRLIPAFNLIVEEIPPEDEAGWHRLMAPATGWVMHVGPRETVHGEAVFWPTRRGEARFSDVRLWTTFPFGLIKKSVTLHQPQHTLIYPRLHELRRGVLDAVTPTGPLGTRVSHQAGIGDDYYGLREYRPGDSLRHIAWKRTAFIDELVSIERSRPNPPRLRIILNLLRQTAELEAPLEQARVLEERAISLVASFVHAGDLAGYEIGLTVLGADVPVIPLRRNQWHVAKMMAALASIDLDARRIDPAGPLTLGPQRAGLIVVHPDRVEPVGPLTDAWHLTARQLVDLTTGAIGWKPQQQPSADPAAAAGVEAAA